MDDREQRIDRRSWLGRMGALAAGTAGFVVALGARQRLGLVTAARAQPAGAQAYRVNLGFVSAYIVARGDTAVIIDSGVAGSAGRIDEVLRASGVQWEAVQAVVLTHHHPDHQGSAADLFFYAPLAELYTGEADVEQIDRSRLNRPVLTARAGDLVHGLRVVPSPGHTIGHISLLDEESGTLFVGDALVNFNNTLAVPPQNTADMAMANATVRQLGALSFERAMFGHGDPIEGGAAAAFAALGASLP